MTTVEEEEEAAVVLRKLLESVDAQPDDPNLHFQLGLYLWEKAADSKDKAAEHFVLAAKLNPQKAAAFKYLGHYYGRADDSQRALKCYQRAVTLNADDGESGEALCNMLDQEGKESLEVAVCKEASGKSPRAFWAFRRLGYLQVHQSKWSDAVPSLQQAIRGYPTCADLWEALGLAYHRLGMYTAAIKSYGRAIELEDARVLARIESGNIFVMLGSFRKAIEQFQQALLISTKSLAANYGLASAQLGLSKECINTGAFRWGASLLEEASKSISLCTRVAGNLSSVWKLAGDIQITYAKCFPWMVEGQPLDLDAEAFKSSILSWKGTCCSAAISAKISYQKALHLAPWQANIYADIAISCDLLSEINKSSENEPNSWQLSEKMALGALLLEGDNYELWIALGCLSSHNALKQHALVRALQLDASLAGAWAHLGKLYRKVTQKQLAKQAFDSARSLDPSLSLPWAGMSSDFLTGDVPLDEAFESCLRAVQILPVAEFQIGLAKLALLSGHSASSQVYAAICQAVQRAPYYPESHNLMGLVFEARHDYCYAAASYRLALHAIRTPSRSLPDTSLRDVTVNLARSLCKAGKSLNAARECESLMGQGALDVEGLHVYAFSLWQLGNKEGARSTARTLAAKISSMEKITAAASVTFICRLLYHMSGLDLAINSILKMPKELFQNSNISFILAAINALDINNQLNPIIAVSRSFLVSHEEITEMHFLIALGKLIKDGSEYCLGYGSGVSHLRKALHMYPNSILLRQSLGYLLLLSKEWNDSHLASRCCVTSSAHTSSKEGLRSPCEILGAGSVACYAIGNSRPRFSYPTCASQCFNEPQSLQLLQKWLRQEPWNHNARYLLILNLLQKAREERFPRHLCVMINRLVRVALSNELYLTTDIPLQYQKFQLLLCAAETKFQEGNPTDPINLAIEASRLTLPKGYLFFAHLLLCRAYTVKGDMGKFEEAFQGCLDLGTHFHVGWICLKLMQLLYGVKIDSSAIALSFDGCSERAENSHIMWIAVFNLIQGLIFLNNRDFLSAEECLAGACSLLGSESCFLLCRGIACMELAKQGHGPEFLSLAVRTLAKLQETVLLPLPIVSTLLAQAEGSRDSKEKWENNLRMEWFTWAPEMRPAELFLQMHLLAAQHSGGSSQDPTYSVIWCQSPLKWVCRAIHTDPSCSRYWRVLLKLTADRSAVTELLVS